MVVQNSIERSTSVQPAAHSCIESWPVPAKPDKFLSIFGWLNTAKWASDLLTLCSTSLQNTTKCSYRSFFKLKKIYLMKTGQ